MATTVVPRQDPFALSEEERAVRDTAREFAQRELAPTIAPPPGSAVAARVTSNAIGADENGVEALFPGLFPAFVDGVGESFAAFPLPAFLGLDLNVAEVARDDNAFVLYADLDPVPQTRLENVELTDLSSADSATDSVFDVNEWRHRIRPVVSPTSSSSPPSPRFGWAERSPSPPSTPYRWQAARCPPPMSCSAGSTVARGTIGGGATFLTLASIVAGHSGLLAGGGLPGGEQK